jgi:hypothetical protein
MRTSMRTLVALAFALVVLPVQADDVRAIPEVTLDLSNRKTGGVLPFDTPFAFTGTVSDRTRKIVARYYEVDPTAQLTSAMDATASGGTAKGSRLVWERDSITTIAANGVVPFRLVAGELTAKKYYVFTFDIQADPKPEDVAKFSARSRTIIAAVFDDLKSLDVKTQVFPAIRDELQKQLVTAAGSGFQINAPGTIFDSGATWDQIGKDFQEVLLLGGGHSQSLKLLILGDANANVPGFNDKVSTAANSLASAVALGRKVVNGLGSQGTAIPAERSDVAAFVGLADFQIVEVARGADPDAITAKLAITGIPTLSELDAREAGYRKSIERISELRQWIRQLETAGTLQKLVTAKLISAADRTDLTADPGRLSQAERDLGNARQQISTIRTYLTDRTQMLDRLVELLQIVAVSSVTVTSSTVGTYDTFANYHVAADAGLLYAPDIEQVLPYVGANFYFSPVNRDVPLAHRGGFMRRFSITLALTMQSLADTNAGRDDLFGDQALIVGAGYRITDIFRIGGGVIGYRRNDPNPFQTSTEVAVKPYAALSFDWRLASTFQGLKSLFD